jgi:hypothetical protein
MIPMTESRVSESNGDVACEFERVKFPGLGHSRMTDPPSASMRDLAQRLLAVEAASASGSPPHAHEAMRVCDKLRISLTRFAGPDGFASLMRRALALARTEVPSVHNIKIKADGSLEGLEELAADAPNSGNGANARTEAAIAITFHLLELLVTFIGEPITLRLVRETWPTASLDENQ